MDTVFSTVTGFNDSKCAQIFFGLLPRCLNPYFVPSHKKGNNIKAYQDFIQYEEVSQCLHRDLASEQKTDEMISINKKMKVKYSLSKVGHSKKSSQTRCN